MAKWNYKQSNIGFKQYYSIRIIHIKPLIVPSVWCPGMSLMVSGWHRVNPGRLPWRHHSKSRWTVLNWLDLADCPWCFKKFNTTGVIGRNNKSLRYPGKSGKMAKYLRSTGYLPLFNHCSTMIVCGNQGRFGKLHSSRTDVWSSTVATITTMSCFLTDAVGFLVTGIVNLWCSLCRCCIGSGDGDLRSSEDFLGVDLLVYE